MKQKMTDDELIDAVLDAAEDRGSPFVSTSEVLDVDAVDLTRRGLITRLDTLVELGKLGGREVGRTKMWWVPGEESTVSRGDVYTDGGVAERVDILDTRLGESTEALRDAIGDIEGSIERLEAETMEDRDAAVRAQHEYKTAADWLFVSSLIILLSIAIAATALHYELGPIWQSLSGAGILAGLCGASVGVVKYSGADPPEVVIGADDEEEG